MEHKMSYYCECEQCRNQEFNPEEYIIKEKDFKILDEYRPLGISGHLRVKDEAMSVAECIDSCIDALDELIITYNKSSDSTEDILKEYAAKYPDKIRLYYYRPNIIKYHKNEYITKYSLIHYLPNYYNFGYLKIKYKYYMKIDADQIYFKDKLLEIREAILSDINCSETINKLLKIDKISWYIPIKKLRNNFRTYYIKKLFNIKNKDYKFNGVEELLNLKDFIIYSKIKNEYNYCLLLGGFDLVLNNNSFYLNTLNVYNGCVGDSFIFLPSKIYKYKIYEDLGVEIINIPPSNYISGFVWVHLGSVKRKHNVNSEIEFSTIVKITSEDILKYIDEKDYIKKDFTIKYFDNDKKYLTQEFYDKFLKKPLKYSMEHYNDNIKRLL
ncbi:hypothetical protein [uncultured Brachyspira sp.]|nr:hypothetical protein [uncultured Brachyspira sp.]